MYLEVNFQNLSYFFLNNWEKSIKIKIEKKCEKLQKIGF